MDPAQLIFAAVEAGTLARRDDALPGGADDVYVSLLKHLHKYFAAGKGDMILSEYLDEPETWTSPLMRAIDKSELVNDPDVLQISKNLLTLIEAKSSRGHIVGIGGSVTGGSVTVGSANIFLDTLGPSTDASRETGSRGGEGGDSNE